MSRRKKHHVELRFNSVGLNKFVCSCGASKYFTSSGSMRHFSWLHVRDEDQALVKIEDFFDNKPTNRPTRRALMYAHKTSTSDGSGRYEDH